MAKEVLPKIVDYYVGDYGQRPFCDWLDVFHDVKTQARIQVRIDRLVLGNFGYSKSLGDGVFELKIDIGPGYRVYFGLADERTVLLLCGGDKKSQIGDIEKAKKYWMNYRRRRDEEK